MVTTKKKLNRLLKNIAKTIQHTPQTDIAITPQWGKYGLQYLTIRYKNHQVKIYNHDIVTDIQLEKRISKIINQKRAQCQKEEILLLTRLRQYELEL